MRCAWVPSDQETSIHKIYRKTHLCKGFSFNALRAPRPCQSQRVRPPSFVYWRLAFSTFRLSPLYRLLDHNSIFPRSRREIPVYSDSPSRSWQSHSLKLRVALESMWTRGIIRRSKDNHPYIYIYYIFIYYETSREREKIRKELRSLFFSRLRVFS
jgi:hypothetical protein